MYRPQNTLYTKRVIPLKKKTKEDIKKEEERKEMEKPIIKQDVKKQFQANTKL